MKAAPMHHNSLIKAAHVTVPRLLADDDAPAALCVEYIRESCRYRLSSPRSASDAAGNCAALCVDYQSQMAFVGRLMHKLVFIFREALSLSAHIAPLCISQARILSAGTLLLICIALNGHGKKYKKYTLKPPL
jgi:hypothetical protein